MSTRCNVTFRERSGSGWKDGPILYHHHDGYPDAMLPKLDRLFLKATTTLREQNQSVDAEKIAAMLVAESTDPQGIPSFCPCRRIHDDIEYKYEVHIDGESGEIHARDRDGHIVGTVVIDAGGDA
jgi:hypothetical protein